MAELAESKPLYKITLISGREIITSINMELIEKAMANAKMIKAGGVLINSSSISTVEPYRWDDIDHFLVGITDPIMKDQLQEILQERKSKNLQTRGVEHLMSIYTDRYWKISNAEDEKWYVYKAKDVYF